MCSENDILVSVVCSTFNHVRYIDRCLATLTEQRTCFSYEVIVHDDASTDGTSEVIRRYAKEYPDLVIPIIQKENLYSRGKFKWDYILPLLRGRYIALCEGDDWWLDEGKLQVQLDYMESHPDCSLCVHDVVGYDEQTSSFLRVFPSYGVERDLATEEIIEGGGGLLGTNSFFYRSSDQLVPDEFTGWGVGDYPRMIYSSIIGKVHYIPSAMSVYRMNTPGSWTSRITTDVEKLWEAHARVADGLKRFNESYGGKYSASVERAVFDLERCVLVVCRDWDALHKGSVAEWFETLPFSEKMKTWVRCFMPEELLALRRSIVKIMKRFTQRERTACLSKQSKDNRA